MTREQAWAIVCEFIQSESLRKHALAVECCVAAYARHHGEDKPSRSVHEVDVASVRKKMKDKAFARAVNRDDITGGAAELGVDLDQHIAFCLDAMKAEAAALGIAGNPA